MIYTSAGGMIVQKARLEVVSNNLANSRTPGYKQELTAPSNFMELLLARLGGLTTLDSLLSGPVVGTLNGPPVLETPFLDLSQGSLMETGEQTDLALSGPGFFVVQTPDGERFTRDGSFVRDAQGQLVTGSGGLVLGANGPIVLPDGPVSVAGDGTVSVAGQEVDRLRVVDFADPLTLQKVGNNYFASSGAAPREGAGFAVSQGFLEASNVDMAESMTRMMEIMRSYEASQRLLQMQDQVTEQTVGSVGTIS